MALLGKLVHEAFASREGVVARAKAQLDDELKAVATGPYELRLVDVSQAVASGEALNQSFKALFGGGGVRVDRVLYGEVPTGRGRLEVAVPFSGKDTLAPQFSMRLPVSAPAGARCERSAMGSWGFGNWVPADGFHGHPATGELCAKLEASNLSADVEWNCELPANYLLKLPWALQVLPEGQGRCRLVMQSGRVGIFFRKLGVQAFLEKTDALARLLGELSALPAASGGVAAGVWFDAVASWGPSPGHNPHGPRPPAAAPVVGQPVNAAAAKVQTRATAAVVLSAVALPVCCLPLGIAGGILALNARSLAAREGLEAPKSTVAALALSGLSTALFLLVLVLGAVAPKRPAPALAKAPARGAPARSQVQVPLGGPGDEAPRLGFTITGVHRAVAPQAKAPFYAAGGAWTFFDAALEDAPDCTFTVGVAAAKASGGFGFGEARLAVKDRAAATCLVEALGEAFDAPAAEPKKNARVGPPLALNTAVLGVDVARGQHGGFGGDGTWTATKWFLEAGDLYGEVFFNYDLTAKRGEFSQKDAEYDLDVVDIVAEKLRDAPVTGRTAAAQGKPRPARP